jgi:dihydroorotase
MNILIKNGRVVDPGNNINDVMDVLVENHTITKVAKNIKAEGATTIEAANKLVLPGLVDMHVHLREPGREDKETIFSGTRAAVHGGVTSVLAMANTLNTVDCVETVRLCKSIIKKNALAHVYITAAITKGREGRELTDFARLKKEGAVALSDDGASIDDQGVMLLALRRAKQQKMLVACHCEDRVLSAGGVVNLGLTSTRMGLKGVSDESEYKRVERDIAIAHKAHAPIHIQHVSCAQSVEIIAKAKKSGIQVTCETAPHYFSLSEEAVLGYDTNFKMNPPLRFKDDVAAVRQGLRDGTIDAIASDHAPHTDNEKAIEFDRAEFGVIGLETILAASLTELVCTGVLTLEECVRKLTVAPSNILDVDKGTLGVGRTADIVIVDSVKEWIVKKENFLSKSKNSAFLGRTLKGAVEYTIVNGHIAYPFKETK